ncbi:MAG: hypothetical protein FWD58_10160, partial [Firmicutes bacterium]|nr:hypothetical protein [Bacillota bacterium]
EYFMITNPAGTRPITVDEFAFYVDFVYSYADTYYGFRWEQAQNYYAGLYAKRSNVTMPKKEQYQLVTVVEDGKAVTMMSQRVTLEWVWQAHPNPVKITSDNKATVTTDGGAFQVTADGLYPEFSIISDSNIPTGAVIDPLTGALTVPAGLTPGQYTVKLGAVQNYPEDVREEALLWGVSLHDPAPQSKQDFTITVIAPPANAEAPSVTFGSQSYKAQEGALLEIPYTLSGTPPVSLTLQVSDTNQNSVTSGIGLKASENKLIASGKLAAGIYHVSLLAENSAGASVGSFVLTVSGDRPSFQKAAYNGYVFGAEAGETKSYRIIPESSGRVAFSLEPVAGSAFPQSGVSLDADTGELFIGVDIEPGVYRFAIKAESVFGFGSATQDCALWIGSEHKDAALAAQGGAAGGATFVPNDNITYTAKSNMSLAARAATHLEVVKTAGLLGRILAGGDGEESALTELLRQTPVNQVIIRWDDKNDAYTNDRLTVDGTSYIVPKTRIEISPHIKEPVNAAAYGYDLTPVALNQTFGGFPNNFNDLYHLNHHDEEWAQMLDDAIQIVYEDATATYIPGYFTLENMLNNYKDMMKEGATNPIINPADRMDFGKTVDALKNQKGVTQQVALGKDTSTVAVGAYFSALEANKSASLALVQDGATITFAGKDISKGAASDALYDFGYTAGAAKEVDMLAAMGTAGIGAESFTYSFAHHGDLPGTASFAVETGFSAGTAVNVYKYDTKSDSLVLIAGNAKVATGGVVTYNNNTMSDYIITTATVVGAEVSDMARKTTDATFFERLLFGDLQAYAIVVLALAAVLITLAIALIALRDKKKPADEAGKREDK